MWPPPCPLPPEQQALFEAAKMPISKHWCLAQRYEGVQNLTWTTPYIDSYRADIASGAITGSYGPRETAKVLAGLRSLPSPVSGSVALVMGTEMPWVEALLLNEGASLVWTFEYSYIDAQHPRMRAKTCQDIAVNALAGRFEPVDLIVSFSSLEHSGLGRYGDALDPDGDRKALAQAWCMLRPGGLLVLGLEMSCADEGEIVFNAHRIYGFQRLAYISANFELEGFLGSCTPFSDNEQQPLVLLRKPLLLHGEAPPPALSTADFSKAADAVRPWWKFRLWR